ncbi:MULTISPECIES: LLM class flavin-dependent oxidoreductase [Halorubrum]|uniref:LLM class flavin-dependent oxidoreductase n=1 Tax=Halorubrum ezzemoulense TaxID=337243 RepID=A0A256K808_HALEZ|nr:MULTISPECIES: LLM class flavin-dependent oxidoreductase [Halorubrum]OYR77255.1 5,10-methylene tetrahydromethanopterin reductase [Halorubrum ezzemoulense]OYR80656.1 5,10-methylene tetrahydromethanopterin reductase [Halorubrum ezzemoulense]PHQ41906.1 5,10-methylene tetrahydromethanopterin reductase [Halorubrum sp. C191]QAY18636.1 LLM class flavin-dependent oxidoreductase [Halorubrum ezzemoulense]
MSDHLHLNLFTMTSVEHVSPGSWRYPGDRSADYADREYWTEVARTAERGGFDAVFFADVRGIYDVYGDDRETAVERAVQTPANDPQLVVPAMAEVTDDLGFAVTRSTTYTHPYQLAREFSTLDHLTDGRVAINVVTSYLESAAANLGLDDRMDKETRYDRADEFLDVCYELWEESWEDDAVEADREAGRYSDPEKVHAIDYEGDHFSVPGPHGCEPSPQRTPVVYQAGSSDYGRSFAARNAEAVFASQPTEEGAVEYMSDVKSRAADAGRDPESLRFFIGVVPIVGETQALAEAKHAEYKRHVDVEATLALLSGFLDMDLSELDPDQKVEHIETDAIQGTMNAFTKAQPDREWTVREVAEFCGLGTTSPKIVGTPEVIADELQRWHEEVGVHGFNVKEVVRPDSLVDFVDLVVPELRERGLVPPADAEPPGETLRERLLGEGQTRLRADHPTRQ